MDGVLDELQLRPGYPVIGGSDIGEDDDDDDAQGSEPGPETADYWRKKAEENDYAHKEAVRKISDQGEQIAQLNQTFQHLVLANQQRQQQAAAQTQQQPQNEWQAYYQSLAGQQNGQNQQQAPPQGLTPEQVAALADQRAQQQIQNTMASLQQQDAKAAHLYQKFVTEKPDLVAHQDVVARFYAAADPRVPMEQRYQYAVSQVEAMVNSGRLPKAPKQRQNNYGGSISGGQMNPYVMPHQGAEGKPVSMNDMARELSAWTEERRERLDNRKNLTR